MLSHVSFFTCNFFQSNEMCHYDVSPVGGSRTWPLVQNRCCTETRLGTMALCCFSPVPFGKISLKKSVKKSNLSNRRVLPQTFHISISWHKSISTAWYHQEWKITKSYRFYIKYKQTQHHVEIFLTFDNDRIANAMSARGSDRKSHGKSRMCGSHFVPSCYTFVAISYFLYIFLIDTTSFQICIVIKEQTVPTVPIQFNTACSKIVRVIPQSA